MVLFGKESMNFGESEFGPTNIFQFEMSLENSIWK